MSDMILHLMFIAPMRIFFFVCMYVQIPDMPRVLSLPPSLPPSLSVFLTVFLTVFLSLFLSFSFSLCITTDFQRRQRNSAWDVYSH